MRCFGCERWRATRSIDVKPGAGRGARKWHWRRLLSGRRGERRTIRAREKCTAVIATLKETPRMVDVRRYQEDWIGRRLRGDGEMPLGTGNEPHLQRSMALCAGKAAAPGRTCENLMEHWGRRRWLSGRWSNEMERKRSIPGVRASLWRIWQRPAGASVVPTPAFVEACLYCRGELPADAALRDWW